MDLNNKIQTSQVENSTIGTSCKDCVFYSKEQCTHNIYTKLNKYNYPDVNIKLDKENNNYITNHICVFCRPTNWSKFYKTDDLNKLVEFARKEVTLSCTLLIYIEDNETDHIKQHIQDRINEIHKFKLLPKNIIFINHTTQKLSFIYNICKESFIDFPNLKWSVENIINFDFIKNEIIDLTTTKIKTPYFIIYDYWQKLPENLLSKIDSELNDKLNKFLVLILPGGYFIQKSVFDSMGKNNTKPFIDKIRNITTRQDCSYLLQSMEF